MAATTSQETKLCNVELAATLEFQLPAGNWDCSLRPGWRWMRATAQQSALNVSNNRILSRSRSEIFLGSSQSAHQLGTRIRLGCNDPRTFAATDHRRPPDALAGEMVQSLAAANRTDASS
jgi:hypothetical protein